LCVPALLKPSQSIGRKIWLTRLGNPGWEGGSKAGGRRQKGREAGPGPGDEASRGFFAFGAARSRPPRTRPQNRPSRGHVRGRVSPFQGWFGPWTAPTRRQGQILGPPRAPADDPRATERNGHPRPQNKTAFGCSSPGTPIETPKPPTQCPGGGQTPGPR